MIVKHITLQGVDIMISNTSRRVVIKDPLETMTFPEAEVLVKYLFDEGFIKCEAVHCEIVREIDE
jgi:hypothetical protein